MVNGLLTGVTQGRKGGAGFLKEKGRFRGLNSAAIHCKIITIIAGGYTVSGQDAGPGESHSFAGNTKTGTIPLYNRTHLPHPLNHK